MQSSAMHNPRLETVPPQTFKFSKGTFFCTSPNGYSQEPLIQRTTYPKSLSLSLIFTDFSSRRQVRMTPETLYAKNTIHKTPPLSLLPPHGNQELHLLLASCFFPPRALQFLTTSPCRVAILTRNHMFSVRGPVFCPLA